MSYCPWTISLANAAIRSAATFLDTADLTDLLRVEVSIYISKKNAEGELAVLSSVDLNGKTDPVMFLFVDKNVAELGAFGAGIAGAQVSPTAARTTVRVRWETGMTQCEFASAVLKAVLEAMGEVT